MRTLLTLCIALTPLLVTATDCPEGYDDLNLDDNRCYMYSLQKKTWTLAYTSCLTSGDGKGNLLTVADANSFYPQYFEVRSLGQDLWTGLLNVGGQRSWADGTVYDDSIAPFFSEDAGDDLYGYLSGDDGLFRFNDGSTERGYACYVDMTEEPSTTEAPTPPPPCEADWDLFGETCYLFSTVQEYWPSAGHACHEHGAELVSINDTSLLTFLLLTADSSTVYWTGLENRDDTYVWEDGTSTDNIEQVIVPYMDDWSDGSDCVAMYTTAFPEPLKHMDCLTQQNYICYKTAASEDLYASENLDFWL